MMNLDEAIQHCEEVAKIKRNRLIRGDFEEGSYAEEECQKCAEEHRQLAEWLKELKAYKEQSGDAISRQVVLDATVKRNSIWNMITNSKGENLEEIISQLPSVSPQQMTGRWIAQDIHNCHTDFKCSACGYIHSFMHLYGKPTADYTYCPKCGCKMREVEG